MIYFNLEDFDPETLNNEIKCSDLEKNQHMVKNEYMCVGATKGTFRRDIKMIVNHDYMKQCIIFTKQILADYTKNIVTFHSTDFCMYLYTSTHQFWMFCVYMLLVPYFSLNPIRSGSF